MNATRRPSAGHRASRRTVRGARLRQVGLAPALVASVLGLSLALGACSTPDDDPEPRSTPAAEGGEPREIGTFSATGLQPVEDKLMVTVEDAQQAGYWMESLGATPEVQQEVVEAVETAAPADDETVWGVVLSTGCLAPESWTFTQVDDEWTVDVVPDEKEATTTCIAPVTSIGFVAVPSDG